MALDATALSRDPAVGEAYVADPLVYHGGWKRPTLEAFVAADETILAGPRFGDLPLLYVHGRPAGQASDRRCSDYRCPSVV